MTLTTLKETARKEFVSIISLDAQYEFLNEVVERTYHATKKEWLLKMNDEYTKGLIAGMKIGRKDTKEEVRGIINKSNSPFRDSNLTVGFDTCKLRILSALEDTTTSPNH